MLTRITDVEKVPVGKKTRFIGNTLRLSVKSIRLLMDRKSFFARYSFILISPAFLLFSLFSSTGFAKNVTLGWDPNPEPDLEGYIIYRNPGSPGPPYKFSSELSEDDLSDPLAPMVTLTGLKKNTEYFIAVTAYDSQGNESYFSDDVCVEIIDTIINNCSPSVSANSNSRTSGGGGGGGGCFINSTAGDLDNFDGIYFAVLVIGSFAVSVFVLGPRLNVRPSR